MKRFSRSSAILLIAVLTASVLFEFRPLLSAEELPLYRDLLFYFFPLKEFLGDCLRQGLFPTWNPWIQLGTPFLAGLQTGVFYPPSLLLALPTPLGFNAFVAVHYVIAVSGACLWLRERGHSAEAAAIGALGFTIGGFLVSMMNVLNNLQAVGWAPWILLFASGAARSHRAWCGLAIVTALCLLGGAPEMTAMILGLAFIDAITSPGAPVSARARSAGLIATAIASGIALAAFQLLPTAELTPRSVRATPMTWAEVATWSLQPVTLLRLFFPQSAAFVADASHGDFGPMLERSSPWISSIYLGIITMVFATAGTFRRRATIPWFAVVVGGVTLAFGSNLPVFGWLYTAAPSIVGRFRYPEKFYCLIQLAIVILAAEGVDGVRAREIRAMRGALACSAALAGVALGILALRHLSILDLCDLIAILRADPDMALAACIDFGSDLVFKAGRLLTFTIMAAALLVLFGRGLVSRGLFGALSVLLVFGDLASANLNLNLTLPYREFRDPPLVLDPEVVRREDLRVFSYQTFYGSTPDGPIATGFVKTVKAFYGGKVSKESPRFWQSLTGNSATIYRLRVFSGDEAMETSANDFLMHALEITPRELGLGVLRAMSVGWLVGEQELMLPGLEPVPPVREIGYRVYRLQGAQPRARLARRLRVGKTPVDAYNEMIAKDFDPAIEAVVTELPPGWEDDHTGMAGRVRIVSESPDMVVLESETERFAFAVLGDANYPGWSASIDGQPTRLYLTNVVTRGVVVPAGHHRIEFSFRPTRLRLGAAISGLAALAILGIAVRTRRSAA